MTGGSSACSQDRSEPHEALSHNQPATRALGDLLAHVHRTPSEVRPDVSAACEVLAIGSGSSPLTRSKTMSAVGFTVTRPRDQNVSLDQCRGSAHALSAHTIRVDRRSCAQKRRGSGKLLARRPKRYDAAPFGGAGRECRPKKGVLNSWKGHNASRSDGRS